MECIFCAIASRKIAATVVYEDEKSIAFMDINPANKGHTLVITKAHFRTLFDLDESTLADVMKSSLKVAKAVKKALQPDGMNLVQSNEKAGFQTVFHFHLHLIPRWNGDRLISMWEPKSANIDEINELAARIRAEL